MSKTLSAAQTEALEKLVYNWLRGSPGVWLPRRTGKALVAKGFARQQQGSTCYFEIVPEHIGRNALRPGRQAVLEDRNKALQDALGIQRAHDELRVNLSKWYAVSNRVTQWRRKLEESAVREVLSEVCTTAKQLIESQSKLQDLQEELIRRERLLPEPTDDEVKTWVITRMLTRNNPVSRTA